ncbi:accessory gene regulator B family protein [Paenibacillus crassostreae]|uniref:Accessory regulator AgrB n=1 Tax=Paenibacillus crassostreae TaxID=1763538 RepID=A0A162MZD0_9BACL|nr:accessory gene regulator B family protein [Paenibacillus crassostreae]AOZ91282.1 hypothetical protein LPB68_03075 [Paenibacillus crassostreae]OAB74559.1 hypothetical protein PNBC_10885 [Paenibacillus crassostreae]
MIEIIAMKMARRIKSKVPNHPSSIVILKHAIAILLNTFFIILLSLVVSYVTGNVKEIIIILVSFALLRLVSGGMHLKSGDSCVLLTTTLFTFLLFVNLSLGQMYILTSICLILVFIYSPSRIENQSRIPKKYYGILKMISVLLVATNFWILSPILTATFFVQALTLVRWKR